jgi:hypothetical protein
MDPDVAKAIPELVQRGVIPEDKSGLLLRIARGDLLSVQLEIRLLFYLGVLLTVGGVSLLVQQNYRHIGPVVIAAALAGGALAALGWVGRKAPPFSWEETPSPSLASDYLLLLGVLLASADLAFIEVQFTPLGANWPWHLLIVSILMACLAVRYDSRTVFSLALSTFAAWRGLSVSIMERPIWFASEETVRWNAVGCGLLFLLLGWHALSRKRKAHFEPVAVHLGWLLVLGAFVSGTTGRDAKGVAYILLLAVTGAALAWFVRRKRRFGLFAMGVFAVYIAALSLVFQARLDSVAELIAILVVSLALIAFLWKAQKAMREPV